MNLLENSYGFLESVEVYGNRLHARFDSFPISWAEKLLASKNRLDGIQQMPTYTISISVEREAAHLLPGLLNRNFKEACWYGLRFGARGVEGQVYAHSDVARLGEAKNISIVEFSRIDGRSKLGRDLLRNVSLSDLPDAKEDQILAAMTPGRSIPRKEKFSLDPAYFAVYDVGQGNCNAVCNKMGQPLLYFDLGGGMGRNAKTYKNRLRFCYTLNPPVILSHWDQDHWFSALQAPQSGPRYTALDSKWIVPRQKFGPAAMKLALELHSRKNLLVWPKAIPAVTTVFGTVVRCIGKKTNDSGLALVSCIKQNDSEISILAPGDANYRYLPIQCGPVDHLVASHHGGFLRCSAIPTSTGRAHCRIALSFGRGNYEKHPSKTMLAKYYSAGWKLRRATTRGAIGLGLPSPLCPGCKFRYCDLKIAQI